MFCMPKGFISFINNIITKLSFIFSCSSWMRFSCLRGRVLFVPTVLSFQYERTFSEQLITPSMLKGILSGFPDLTGSIYASGFLPAFLVSVCFIAPATPDFKHSRLLVFAHALSPFWVGNFSTLSRSLADVKASPKPFSAFAVCSWKA